MLILALDSTAVSASVALCRDGVLLGEYTVNVGLTHSETLLPMIESLLATTHTSIKDIDAFACNAGPGSFTGVRIGVATIKGLAFEKNKPCVSVSTLDSLARNAAIYDGVVCPVMNARRQQVYNALFRCIGGNLTRLTSDRAISIAELGNELNTCYSADNIYLVGDGARMTHDAFEIAGIASYLLPDRLLNQSAANTALCASDVIEKGHYVTDTELVPIYLRPSQAERMRSEELYKDAPHSIDK